MALTPSSRFMIFYEELDDYIEAHEMYNQHSRRARINRKMSIVIGSSGSDKDKDIAPPYVH